MTKIFAIVHQATMWVYYNHHGPNNLLRFFDLFLIFCDQYLDFWIYRCTLGAMVNNPRFDCFDIREMRVHDAPGNREKMPRWENSRVYLSGRKLSEAGYFIQYLRPRKNTTVPDHTHDFFEIVVVLSGNAVHNLDGKNLPMSAGDVFFLNQKIRHTYKVAYEPFEIINIMFRPEIVSGISAVGDPRLAAYKPFEPFFRTDLNNRVSFPPRPFQRIALSAGSLVHWYFNTENSDFIRARIKSVYETLYEEFTRVVPVRFTQTDFLATIIDYVQKHSSEKISLTHLAEISSLEKSYVSAKFKKETGENINQYISRHRVGKAKELLVGTSMQILDIALATGFGALSHFNVVFKKTSGLSPGRFRSMHSRHDARAKIVRI